MKKQNQLFSSVFTILFCIVAFAVMIVFSVSDKPIQADEKTENVTKSGSFSGKNLLFVFPFDSAFFGFSENEIQIYFLDLGQGADAVSQLGYQTDKIVTSDYSFLSGLIDRLGGIEMQNEGETLSYTGVQVTDLLKQGVSKAKRREITEKIFEKIRAGNFDTDELNFLIENTESDLSFPDGYDILRILPSAAKNLNFINQEDVK